MPFPSFSRFICNSKIDLKNCANGTERNGIPIEILRCEILSGKEFKIAGKIDSSAKIRAVFLISSSDKFFIKSAIYFACPTCFATPIEFRFLGFENSSTIQLIGFIFSLYFLRNEPASWFGFS